MIAITETTITVAWTEPQDTPAKAFWEAVWTTGQLTEDPCDTTGNSSSDCGCSGGPGTERQCTIDQFDPLVPGTVYKIAVASGTEVGGGVTVSPLSNVVMATTMPDTGASF